MPAEWSVVEQPNPRFRAEGQRLWGPFYRLRILDTATGTYLPLASSRSGGVLTGRSSVSRAVKFGIQRRMREGQVPTPNAKNRPYPPPARGV